MQGVRRIRLNGTLLRLAEFVDTSQVTAFCTTVTRLVRPLKNGTKGDDMEIWNIVTTLFTVAVVGLGGVEVGYYLGTNEK